MEVLLKHNVCGRANHKPKHWHGWGDGGGGPVPTLNPKPGFGMEGIAKTNI